MERVVFKIPKELKVEIEKDLKRDHEYAYERIGFLLTRSYKSDGETQVLAYDYYPIIDENYIKDSLVGARINSNAIRNAMQTSLTENCGVFHIHRHCHNGKPSESIDDEQGIPPMMESISRLNHNENFGYLILSIDSVLCKVYSPNQKTFFEADIFIEVGYPMKFVFKDNVLDYEYLERQKRQSFLGEQSIDIFKKINVGIVGYGGGGSHIGQQLAHIGFENIFVFDHDSFEESNINRLIGANYIDIEERTKKTTIAERTIKNILPSANVIKIQKKWQDAPEELNRCHVVIGCVDSFIEREQLEAETRRYLIPLMDIGMDIHKVNGSYSISGQVLLSLPTCFCMKCCGFITDEKLEIEAKKYGDVGGHPQVVWSNGVLASNAVGIIVDLLLGWSGLENRLVYFSYDGNRGLLAKHNRLIATPEKCKHYPVEEIGPPRFFKV